MKKLKVKKEDICMACLACDWMPVLKAHYKTFKPGALLVWRL